jgi:uncharacterized C2H2 Zn-finger protein
MTKKDATFYVQYHKYHTCPYCNMQFRYKATIDEHIRKIHKMDYKNEQTKKTNE